MKRLLGLVVALCSCSADPGYEPRYEPHESPSPQEAALPKTTTKSIEAPRKTVVALQGCADQFALKLSGKADSYAVLYDLEVTGNGINAKVKDSMIPGSALETCLTQELERMEAPDGVMGMSQVSPATSQASPQSRSLVGIVQAAPVVIALAPIVLVAGGVTILIGVTIFAVADAVRRWPVGDDDDEDCTARYDNCIERGGGGQRGNNWNESRCGTCRAVCQKEKSWPAFVPLFGKGMVPCP